MEFDFIVAPGADPALIRMGFEGADSLRISPEGELLLHVPGGTVVQHAPVIYQELDEGRQTVAGSYTLHGENEVRFQVAAYDRTDPLIIDPILSYGTYLGGSLNDEAYGIAVDGAGNSYIMGSTKSTNFPTAGTAGAYQTAYQGGTHDVFVTKINAAGDAVIYSTYLGGNDDDGGLGVGGIAVDASGNAYITGAATSNFPTKNALQGTSPGSPSAFVTKLSVDGSDIDYSTYLGGSGLDAGMGIAVDVAGNAYVTGRTTSGNFPTSATPFQPTNGGSYDAFVTKLDASGTTLVYSTYLGASSYEFSSGIAVDATGQAHISGTTGSSNLPGASPPLSGSSDAFVAKLSANGSVLYSMYLGGSSTEEGKVAGSPWTALATRMSRVTQTRPTFPRFIPSPSVHRRCRSRRDRQHWQQPGHHVG